MRTSSRIYDVRAGLEGRAARLLARTHRSKDVAALRGLIARFPEAADSGDPHDFWYADLDFHTALIELTRNSLLLELFNRAVPALRALISLGEHAYSSLETTTAEHKEVVDAIASGDEDLAARSAERHVEQGLKYLAEWSIDYMPSGPKLRLGSDSARSWDARDKTPARRAAVPLPVLRTA